MPNHRATTIPRLARASILALALALLSSPSATVAGEANPPPEPEISLEYKVKAAFLLNFAKFVEWPKASFAKADSPLVIGVVGADPFGSFLDRAATGKTAQERSLQILRPVLSFEDPPADAKDAPRKLKPEAIASLKSCHLLYLGGLSEEDRKPVLLALAGGPELIVGEAESFATQGAVIGFCVEDNKVRFAINPDEARRRSLQISSKLLQLAKIVRDPRISE